MPDIINLSSHLVTGALADQPMYEVPNAGMLVLQDIINATWNLGNAKSDEAYTKMAVATQAGGFLDPLLAPSITAGTIGLPSVTAPNVVIPTNIDTTQVMSLFDTKYGELVTFLHNEFTGFRSAYFPNEQAAYTAAEAWLTAALANPSAGIPIAVQQQIWGDDHARIAAESLRAQDGVIAQFAARGFPLPPDAAASLVMQIEQKAQDEMAESSRKVAIMSVDMQKFNVEKLLSLRGMALDASVKYVAALAGAPDIASKLLGVGIDAQSKLISAASQFYAADTNAKEMVSNVQKYNNSITLEADTKNQSTEMEMVKLRVDAMMRDLQLLAQQATSLFNNLHASVGMSTGGQTSMSVNPA